ncbi:unnamed protein product [Periconia digitata]|uniref:Uncharacterized protein n=1 Tax=Periconia digitata TaxID=1303443 RepID=A0A9W4UCN2_9PLEO|nr:unnamed protein product [Periconia digitata]
MANSRSSSINIHDAITAHLAAGPMTPDALRRIMEGSSSTTTTATAAAAAATVATTTSSTITESRPRALSSTHSWRFRFGRRNRRAAMPTIQEEPRAPLLNPRAEDFVPRNTTTASS